MLNPGPATTTDTVKKALVVPDICPREEEFCKLVVGVREKITRVVRGEQTHTAVLFGASGTGAVEACISSLLGPQDGILIHSNGAYGKRMLEIARVFYEERQIAVWEQEPGTYPDLAELEGILKKNKEITYLAMVHHETTTGMLNPAERALEICKRHGVRLILDGMSSYAGMPIDLKETPYDFLISSSNKCIQGMAGVSFVISENQALQESQKHRPKNYYFNLWQQHSVFEKTRQMQFTPPVQVFYALDCALNEFFAETGPARFERYTRSWEALVKGLRALELKLLLPEAQQSKLLTTVLDPKHPSYSFKEMHDYLYDRGITLYPGKLAGSSTFRIANIGQIDVRDIEAFLKLLGLYFKEKGINARCC